MNEEEQLIAAVKEGDIKVVTALLDKNRPGISANLLEITDQHCSSLLSLAVLHGHVDIAELLLKRGAFVDQLRDDQVTPLYLAVELGNEVMVKLLLDHRATIIVEEFFHSINAFSIAVGKGHESMVRLLLDRGAPASELYLAAKNGHEAIVKLLLDRGAPINSPHQSYFMPITGASYQGHTAVVKLLLERGAALIPFDREHFFWSPFLIACARGHEEIVRLFLADGKSVEYFNDRGLPPLFVAACNGHDAIVKLLLEHGALVDQACANKAVFELYEFPNTESFFKDCVLQIKPYFYLKKEEAQKTVESFKQATPLFIACYKGHETTVQLLLEHGASLEAINELGFTPIHAAAHGGHIKLVSQFLEKDISVNHIDQKDRTLLYCAAISGSLELVEMLLLKGAAPDISSKIGGLTPLMIAVKFGYDLVARRLLAAGSKIVWQDDDDHKLFLIKSFKPAYESIFFKLLCQGAKAETVLAYNRDALHLAAFHGNDAAVKWLLEGGAEVNQLESTGFTPLQRASKHDHENIVRLLLNHPNIKIDNENQDGFTALHSAVSAGNEIIAALLLDHKASINCKSHLGYTPMSLAIEKKQLNLVRLLLDHGLPIDLVDKEEESFLHKAIKAGSFEIFQFLLSRGASMDVIDLKGQSLLHAAVKAGNMEMIQYLLSRGAHIGQGTAHGDSPLHFAVICHDSEKIVNSVKIVMLLLDNGADIEYVNKLGQTPLICAATFSNVLSTLLINRGAVVEKADHRGISPLFSAIQATRCSSFKLLLLHGANINRTDSSGHSLLHYFVQFDKYTAFLLDHGANIHQITNQGYSALHLAAEKGHLQTVALLLDRGATIDQRARGGFTPLYIAAQHGQERVVALLLDRGANINQIVGFGDFTALYVAAMQGHEKVVALLLEKGAVFQNPSSALDIALDRGHATIVSKLLRAGVGFFATQREFEQCLPYLSEPAKLKQGPFVLPGAMVDDDVKIALSIFTKPAELRTLIRQGEFKWQPYIVRFICTLLQQRDPAWRQAGRHLIVGVLQLQDLCARALLQTPGWRESTANLPALCQDKVHEWHCGMQGGAR